MRIKKIVSIFAASILATTTFVLPREPVYAVETFSTPSDFITDVVNVSLTDIESTTKSTAIANMKSNITVSGDEVFYDGASIGYWYSEDSSTLYANSSKTDILIEASGSGYNVDPTLLGTILTDVNADLIENYIPTTDDWSKIIGKYDVTLGDITIPADQWIEAEASADGTDPLNDGKSVNISQLSGIDQSHKGSPAYNDYNLYIFAWLVDDTGELYLQNQIIKMERITGGSNYWYGACDTMQASPSSINTIYKVTDNTVSTSSSSIFADKIPLIKAGAMQKGNGLYTRVYATDSTHSSVYTFGGSNNTTETNAELYKVDSPSDKNTCALENAKSYGIVYFTGAQAAQITSAATFNSEHDNMFTSNSCSKQVVGNKTLTKRILKLGALAADDVLNVSAAGWIVNGTTNIDKYLASQYIVTAGDTASIDVTAEIEPLSFKVVVPTTLPIYVSTDGTVTTATNATVENQSNAAVKITDLEIIADAESGWTLVDNTPSSERDANEFTFTTSLTVDTELSVDEVLPFTYNAELSPITAGTESFNLATVLLTVDWADI